MKKYLRVFIAILLVLCCVNLNAYAQEIKLSTNPQEKVVNPGERVMIDIYIDGITGIDEGINTIVGYLEYDKDWISEIEFLGEENWKVTYNDIKDSELYGKFAITTMQNGVKEQQKIATLMVTLKDDLKEGETEVKLNKLVSSDGYESIETDDKVVKLIIKEVENPVKEEQPKEEPKEEQPKEEIKELEDNKENILTGDNIFLYVAIIIVVIFVNVIIIVVLKKKKKDDK